MAIDRIKITEIDETTFGVQGQGKAVFIPGFSSITTDPEFAIGRPEYVSSVNEFKRKFLSVENREYKIPKIDATETSEGTYDKSCIIALELLAAGLPVVYCVVSDELTTDKMYEFLNGCFSTDVEGILMDRQMNLGWITSGGYPSIVSTSDTPTSIAQSMILLAKARQDCIALIDHEEVQENLITLPQQYANLTDGEYAAAFTPWGNYEHHISSLTQPLISLPASFGYLLCVADVKDQAKRNLSMAGVSRGLVPQLKSLNTGSQKLTNAIADSYQSDLEGNATDEGYTPAISINAITDIRPYGLCIWGNRTLKKAELGKKFASCFLNIRTMVNNLKTIVFDAANSLLFEQNTDVLWVNFKSMVAPFLDQMVGLGCLSNYKLIKEPTEKKTEVKVTIRLYPVYAVESFDITIYLSDSEIALSTSNI